MITGASVVMKRRGKSERQYGMGRGNLSADSGGLCVGTTTREEREEMTVTRHSEGIEVSDIIGGYLVSKLYIGYTVREAKRMFKEENK